MKTQPPNNISRILFIAYYYPPLGGPASIRLGKTVKYLRKAGITVDVITVKGILYHSYDYELMDECTPDNIEYVSSFEILSFLKYTSAKSQNGNSCYFSLPESIRAFIKRVFPVDEKIFWFFSARRTALKLLRRRKYDLIFASIGPYTSALVGYSLSKMTGLPLLVDYRDHWTLNPYDKFLTPIHKAIANYYEKKVIKQATWLTCVSRGMRQELKEKYKNIIPEKSEVIYNGYDESDFEGYVEESNSKKDEEFTFIYTGSFYRQITPYYFCEAVKKLKSEHKQQIKIKFVGNYHRDTMNILNDAELQNIVEIVPYLPHKKAIEQLMSADALLLFLPDVGRGGESVLTSKVFEYLRSQKPLLAMIPEKGEAAALIRQYGNTVCPFNDVESIATAILDICSQPKQVSQGTSVAEYSRYNQTLKLIELINGYFSTKTQEAD